MNGALRLGWDRAEPWRPTARTRNDDAREANFAGVVFAEVMGQSGKPRRKRINPLHESAGAMRLPDLRARRGATNGRIGHSVRGAQERLRVLEAGVR
jgi:hypothetical protein